MADEQGTVAAVQTGPESMPPSESAAESARETAKNSTSASRRVRARLARRMTAQRSGDEPRAGAAGRGAPGGAIPRPTWRCCSGPTRSPRSGTPTQLRRSGDPYITHPLAVANILAELGMDTTTLVAALLHDTVEDTGYTLEALTADFGDEVGHLVDGVTKLDKVVLGSAAEGETIRKMIIAMARDPRVLVIKVADRLHNMRTMRFLPPEKQARKARETLEVIAPLAHRLGMATVKWELEDLSFAILHPKKYEEIVRLVADRAPSRDTYLAKVRAEISRHAERVEDQRRRRGPAQALLVDLPEDDRQGPRLRRHPRPGRRAHPVRRDPRLLRRRGRGALAVAADGRAGSRTTSPSPGSGCTSRCTPPWSGPEGKPLEVQIRTRDMHRTAEYGIAAHWRYKESQGPQRRSGQPRRRRDRRHGLDASAARLAAGGRGPRRVPRVAALRPRGRTRSSCSPRRAT